MIVSEIQKMGVDLRVDCVRQHGTGDFLVDIVRGNELGRAIVIRRGDLNQSNFQMELYGRVNALFSN